MILCVCSDVVRLERPDLEKQRNELIVNINKAKTELKVRTSTHVHVHIHDCVCTTTCNIDRALKTPSSSYCLSLKAISWMMGNLLKHSMHLRYIVHMCVYCSEYSSVDRALGFMNIFFHE